MGSPPLISLITPFRTGAVPRAGAQWICHYTKIHEAPINDCRVRRDRAGWLCGAGEGKGNPWAAETRKSAKTEEQQEPEKKQQRSTEVLGCSRDPQGTVDGENPNQSRQLSEGAEV